MHVEERIELRPTVNPRLLELLWIKKKEKMKKLLNLDPLKLTSQGFSGRKKKSLDSKASNKKIKEIFGWPKSKNQR